MKKLIALFSAGIMIATLFAGCGNTNDVQTEGSAAQAVSTAQAAESTQAPAPKLEGEIVFGNNRTDINDTKIADLANQFMAANPGTKITCEAYQDFTNVIKTRAAANELPDITAPAENMTKDDWPNYFVPLDDLGYTKDTIEFYDAGVASDGKQYLITNGVNFDGVMVYNKKAFQAAGITTVPKTEDEFFAACQKLKDAGIIPVVTGYKDGWCLDPWTFKYTNSRVGSNYRNVLVDNLLDPYVNNDDFTKGYKMLRQAQDKGYLETDLMSATWDQAKASLSAGKAGMMLMASWLTPQLVDGGAQVSDVGMFPAPDAKYIAKARDLLWGVAKSSKYPELAKAFLKYMWDEGRFANITGIASPLIGVQSALPGADELLASGLPTVAMDPDSDNFKSVYAKSEFRVENVLQEYLVSKTPDDVLKKYNDKWLNARKAVMGK